MSSTSAHSEGLAVRSALLRLPTDEGRRWLSFDNAVETVTAWTLDEVAGAFARIEQLNAAGHWCVGMVSIDAAPAFDAALAARRDPNVPLVAFGAFDEPNPSRGPAGRTYEVGDWTGDRDQAAYEADVAGLKGPIASGVTYQVNYTMRLHADFAGDSLGLFEALSRAQRADHLAHLDLGTAAVCSASPELFFHKNGRRISSRPMKGTRPRHPDPVVDAALIDELVSSEKDRAENTMIVDMVRNDLGRIAEVGSLHVPALHTVETYPTVHQLTSTVTADTDESLFDLFAALFPGASITGAPKVSTSRIIAEVESTPRGIYTGAVGAVGPDGFAEFNISIRTVWVDRIAGTATYGVGGGIVWDSDPTAEWLEAHDKARVLHRACRTLRLLETIGWEPRAGAMLLDRHLSRVAEAAEHFGYDIDLGEVRRIIDAVDADGPARLRLLVAPDGALELEVVPLTDSPATPWALPLDTQPIDESDELLYFKTTARERYEQAAARFPDAPDVILWNSRGELTETTIGNLVVELDGELVTPPASAGLLPGTFRAELLDSESITEATVRIDDLDRATGLYMINSVRGWVPITTIQQDRSAEYSPEPQTADAP